MVETFLTILGFWLNLACLFSYQEYLLVVFTSTTPCICHNYTSILLFCLCPQCWETMTFPFWNFKTNIYTFRNLFKAMMVMCQIWCCQDVAICSRQGSMQSLSFMEEIHGILIFLSYSLSFLLLYSLCAMKFEMILFFIFYSKATNLITLKKGSSLTHSSVLG